ncbi:MAG: CoA transferase [Dehalococcoidia bacterium]|nr:CoA transferase [Dehalococcoidia bacterium]MCB9484153.1 CoA transferase [Dehalococcoidia bacterium]MCB9491167.1 CoA transferase [Dehalococcoidia bacterium]
MSGPLHGVRVLEFTQIIAGPLGGQHLADMGADVIKVEPPQGEPWRATSQFLPGESKPFHVLNRGKRSLTLDLRNPHAQEVIHRLIGTIDVVVINYRPDVAARMGLDYETLSGLKPDLVYVDSTSFGRRGPWAMKGGYDIVAQAVAGVLSSAARFDAHGTPVLMMGGLPVLDLATGYAIGMAALAGLYHRAVSGEGQFIETSLLQTGLILQHGKFSSLPPADVTTRTRFLAELEEARATGLGYRDIVERKREEYEAGQVANVYYRVYYTADGAIAVGSLSGQLRERFRQAMGIEYDPRDHDPNYVADSAEAREFGLQLRDRLEAAFLEHPSAYWSEYLDAAGVPNGELTYTEELLEHEQVVANDYRVALTHEVLGEGEVQAPPAFQMQRTRLEPTKSSPPLGFHNREVLDELGVSDDEYAAWQESGLFG